jgi:DUF4097 and DUF4098 domain-containing protein YvlB
MTEPAVLTAQNPAPPDPRWLRPVRIGLMVLAALVLLSCTGSVIAYLFVRQTVETTTFDAPVHQIQVSTDTGDITIRAAGLGESTRVTSTGRSAFRKAEQSAVVTDGVLLVRGYCEGHVVFPDSCSMDFEIVVPPGSTVQAESSTGDLRITGPAAAVMASTNTGDVRVIRATEAIKMRSITGDVTGSQLTSHIISAETKTGDVALTFTAPPNQVLAVTGTGDVEVGMPNDGTTYRVSADTSTGDRKITVPMSSTSRQSIEARTSTGDVEVYLRN